jgi:hypothetical protein
MLSLPLRLLLPKGWRVGRKPMTLMLLWTVSWAAAKLTPSATPGAPV